MLLWYFKALNLCKEIERVAGSIQFYYMNYWIKHRCVCVLNMGVYVEGDMVEFSDESTLPSSQLRGRISDESAHLSLRPKVRLLG